MMFGADLSLNIMSLGGLALGIGLLVDNSIVVLENIARHRDMGKPVLDAARDGASEVGTAVTASTLTTVAVFFPLVFVSGIAGQLFRDQALTVTFSLLASLVVALTLIPMLASTGSKKTAEPEPSVVNEPRWKVTGWIRAFFRFVFSTIPTFVARILYKIVGLIGKLFGILLKPFVAAFQWAYEVLDRAYPRLIEAALQARVPVIATAAALFVASVLLIPKLGVELIPQLSQGEFLTEFRMPPGTPLEKTDATIAEIQRRGLDRPGIDVTFAAAGSGNRLDANPDQGGENWGELSVTLVPGAGREGEEQAMAGNPFRSGADTGSPVQV